MKIRRQFNRLANMFRFRWVEICKNYKADSLLAGKMNEEGLQQIIKETLKQGWLGHSKSGAWRGMKDSWVDEFGNDHLALPSHSKGEVEQELIDLKAAAKIFQPKDSIFATEGMKSIESADAEWDSQCTQHRSSLRTTLSNTEKV